MSNKASERGTALVLVAWVLVVVGTIATFLIYRAQSEWAVVVGLERNLRCRQLATLILNERLALLIADETENDSPADSWYGSSTGRLDFERDGFQVTLMVEDEGSKVNLNLSGEAGLEELQPEPEGESEQGLQVALDPLLDWRDLDSEIRNSGAEITYYQSLNPPYKPRDGFFSALTELKQVKEGESLYQLLAPQVTVYGKANPNAINQETFQALLVSAGFDQNWAEKTAEQFADFRLRLRFTSMVDFLRLNSVTLDKLEKLEPLFQFSGSCNLNLASEPALRATLRNAGFKREIAEEIISHRSQQPFVAEELRNFFRNKNAKIKNPQDYFSVVSRIVRFRIWLIRPEYRYYLDVVYERVPGRSQGKWRLYPLAWHSLTNQLVPELPTKSSPEEVIEQETKDGGESNP